MENETSQQPKDILIFPISKEQRLKIGNDLSFINLITSQAKERGYRVVVSGGYSIDGNLGQITRPHNDIDIQIYGQSEQPRIIRDLMETVKQQEAFSRIELRDKGRQEFYHAFFAEGNGLGADIYYVQVTGNPFDSTKVVVKNNGSLTSEHSFNTAPVTLEGVSFEAVNPQEQLEDILKKRARGDRLKPEHDQDLQNLQRILRTPGVW